MTVSTFIVLFAVGAAAVALWIQVRFPKLMPWSLAKLLVHLVLAILLVYAVGPAMTLVGRAHVPSPALTGVFVVGFPVLVYEFVVGAWLVRLAQATGGGFRA